MIENIFFRILSISSWNPSCISSYNPPMQSLLLSSSSLPTSLMFEWNPIFIDSHCFGAASFSTVYRFGSAHQARNSSTERTPSPSLSTTLANPFCGGKCVSVRGCEWDMSMCVCFCEGECIIGNKRGDLSPLSLRRSLGNQGDGPVAWSCQRWMHSRPYLRIT